MRKSFGGIKAPWRPVYDQSASHQTGSTSYQTVLNITGKGKVAIFTSNYGWISNEMNVEVYLDGVTLHYIRIQSNINIFRGDFYFNESIRVRHKKVGDAQQMRTDVAYWVM